jgi:hypothetical protein
MGVPSQHARSGRNPRAERCWRDQTPVDNRAPFVEEIIEYQRPTRYAYTLLSGAPVRDHAGTVELREAGAGTEVSWHLRSTLKIPGVDRLMLPVFKRVIGELLNGGINAAEGAA